MRITNSMIFNRAVQNVQQQSARLFRAQEVATTGKKISRLSDDPRSTHRIFEFREQLTSLQQFKSNRDTLASILGVTENALQGVETVLHRAQELALAGLSDGANSDDRERMGQEVAELFAQVVELGNTDVGGRFVFAGGAGREQAPILGTGGFVGSSQEMALSIASEQTLSLSILGSDFLASDLRPALDGSTALASLNGGAGLSTGSISVTDRAGNNAVIDLSTAVTVDDVLTAISGAAGIAVTASINAAGNGVSLTDTTPAPRQNLTVTEVSGGTTASELGILATRSGAIVGRDLNPTLSSVTPLSVLYDSSGATLGSIRITNGTAEADVDLSAALTIGDAITAINASGVNVTATLNAEGTALDVGSNEAATVAIVTDLNGGSSAADLGIQGQRDVLKTLRLLQEALEKEDLVALDRLLPHLESGLEQVITLRSDVGTRLNSMERVEAVHVAQELTVTSLLSTTEEADAVEAFSRLTQQAVAFEASLAAAARTLQPSLLDFLR